jgi:RecA/RadA recombinase
LSNSSFFKQLQKKSKELNKQTFLLNDENNIYSINGVTDSGCYILNAMLCDGDIFGGIPDGKRIMLSGKSKTGKSLFMCYMIKAYLLAHATATAIIYESEGAPLIEMAKKINMPMDRVIIVPISTVEELTQHSNQILDQIVAHNKENPNNKDKVIMALDSVGMLSTNAEIESALSNDGKADAGRRAGKLKAWARTTSLKIPTAGVPFIIINHVYASQQKYVSDIVSGGEGLMYLCDISLILTKAKDKEGKEQIGNIMKIRNDKSRFIKENRSVEVNMNFKTGMNQYSSLVELGQKLNILKKEGISYIMGKTKVRMKTVRENPQDYLKDELLNNIGEAIKHDLEFGSGDLIIEED